MEKIKDKQLQNANKCPLMGASKCIRMIDGAAMLIVGTEECTYYTKGTSKDSKVFSVVYNNHDVTFGGTDKVYEAVEELLSEYKPASLFIITTCVVEIIGDEFNFIAKEFSSKYNIPIRVIQTNHFEGENQEEGFEKVFAAVDFMDVEELIRKRMQNKKNKSKKGKKI